MERLVKRLLEATERKEELFIEIVGEGKDVEIEMNCEIVDSHDSIILCDCDNGNRIELKNKAIKEISNEVLETLQERYIIELTDNTVVYIVFDKEVC